ncbi:hypothetical protein [Hoeflea sp. TYP-13]|uniref:hypothetical protein n=1 Tax=Hoeflea sp. TYP-13 TaxID=3230023 RepID=UPI0034C5F820
MNPSMGNVVWGLLAAIVGLVSFFMAPPQSLAQSKNGEQVWLVEHTTANFGSTYTGEIRIDVDAGSAELTLTHAEGRDLGHSVAGDDFGSEVPDRPIVNTYRSNEITVGKNGIKIVFHGLNNAPPNDFLFIDPAPHAMLERLIAECSFAIGGDGWIPEYDIYISENEKCAQFELGGLIDEINRNTEIRNRKFRFEISVAREQLIDDHLKGTWVAGFPGEEPRTGKQLWKPGDAEIVDVLVMEDQAGRNEVGSALFPYPFGDDPEAKARGMRTRTLFVVGRGLPQRSGPAVALSDEAPSLDYAVTQTKRDAEEFKSSAADFARGWKKYLEKTGGSQGELEAIIVTAGLEDGVLPGRQKFKLNGAEGHWTLEFGDAEGQLKFVRKLDVPNVRKIRKRVWSKDQNRWIERKELEEIVQNSEMTDVAFIYDQIRLEMELRNSYPVDEFKVELGPPEVFQIDLKTPEGPKTQKSSDVVLKKSADNPRIYQSDIFHIVRRADEDGQHRIDGPRGQVLRADIPARIFAKWSDKRFRAQPRLLPLWLETSPDEVAGSFIGAMRAASRCHGTEPDHDWERMTNRTATDVSNFILTEFVTSGSWGRSIPIKHGDHAAMLLLRDEFIKQMQKNRADYATILQNDRLVLGFVKSINPYLFTDDNPVYRMQVSDPEDLSQTMDFGSFLLQNNDIALPALVRPTRAALQNMISAMDKSIVRATGVTDCDTEELLLLTGVSFDQIADAVAPRLMRYRFDQDKQHTVLETDRLGRAFVYNLSSVASAVQALDAYAEADTQYSIAIGSVILSAGIGSLYSQGLISLVTVIAAELPAVAYSIDGSFREYLASQRELDFAVGASAVIGTDRLDTAELAAIDWMDVALIAYMEAIGLAAGAAGDVVDVLKGARGAPLVDLVTSGEALAGELSKSAARQLSPSEAAQLGAFVAHAKNKALQSGIGSLSDLERQFVKVVDKAGESARQAKRVASTGNGLGGSLFEGGGSALDGVPSGGGLSPLGSDLGGALPGSGLPSIGSTLDDALPGRSLSGVADDFGGGTAGLPGSAFDPDATVILPPRGLPGSDPNGTALLNNPLDPDSTVLLPPRNLPGPDPNETALLSNPLDPDSTVIIPPPAPVQPPVPVNPVRPDMTEILPPRALPGPDPNGTALLNNPVDPDSTVLLPPRPQVDPGATEILPPPTVRMNDPLDPNSTALMQPSRAPVDPGATEILPAPTVRMDDPNGTALLNNPVDPDSTVLLTPGSTVDPGATEILPAPTVRLDDPNGTALLNNPVDPDSTVLLPPRAPVDPGATEILPAPTVRTNDPNRTALMNNPLDPNSTALLPAPGARAAPDDPTMRIPGQADQPLPAVRQPAGDAENMIATVDPVNPVDAGAGPIGGGPAPAAPAELAGAELPARSVDGTPAEPVVLGDFIAEGSFNNVYKGSGDDSVYRVSKVPTDHVDVQIDDAGWSALDDFDSAAVRGPEVRGTYETKIGDQNFRARELEFFENTAARQIEGNPGEYAGVMTPEQAIAYDKATREINKKGYVWLDNHTHNYAFEPHPDGGGKLRVVITDPGGIVKVTGNDAASFARKVQARINNPDPQFVKRMSNKDLPVANQKIFRELEREGLIEDFGDRLALPDAVDDPLRQLQFRTDQNVPFGKVRDLFQVPADELEAARKALRRQP